MTKYRQDARETQPTQRIKEEMEYKLESTKPSQNAFEKNKKQKQLSLTEKVKSIQITTSYICILQSENTPTY